MALGLLPTVQVHSLLASANWGQAAGPASPTANHVAVPHSPPSGPLQDRLVEYDRESAKRTTVYDDQADFFEIDANAWLTGGRACRAASRPCQYRGSGGNRVIL